MKTEEKSEKINRILGIISAVIGIVGSIFGIFQAQQAATLKNEVNSLQTASQQTIVNVVSTLGDDAKTSELTETGDMVAATDQLISVYSSTKTQNAQLTSEAQTLQSENEALKAQVENLKSVLLNTYSMDEVDKVVAQGYLDEVETKRLDNLEMLDIHAVCTPFIGSLCGKLLTGTNTPFAMSSARMAAFLASISAFFRFLILSSYRFCAPLAFRFK